MDRTDRFDCRSITVSVRSGELDRKCLSQNRIRQTEGLTDELDDSTNFLSPSLLPLSCGPSSTIERPIASSSNQSKPIFFHPPPPPPAVFAPRDPNHHNNRALPNLNLPKTTNSLADTPSYCPEADEISNLKLPFLKFNFIFYI